MKYVYAGEAVEQAELGTLLNARGAQGWRVHTVLLNRDGTLWVLFEMRVRGRS